MCTWAILAIIFGGIIALIALIIVYAAVYLLFEEYWLAGVIALIFVSIIVAAFGCGIMAIINCR